MTHGSRLTLLCLAFLLTLSVRALPQAQLVVQTGNSGLITSIAYSKDGHFVASGGTDRRIVLWNVDEGRQLRAFDGHAIEVLSLAFSPDGKTLASGDFASVRLWDVSTGKQLRRIPGGGARSLAFSPDGHLLMAGGFDSVSSSSGEGGKPSPSVKIWDTETFAEVPLSDPPKDWVTTLALSRDGSLLAAGDNGGDVTIFDLGTYRRRQSFHVHGDAVQSVAFAPDGRTLASSSSDRTVKLWDVRTGKTIAVKDGLSREADWIGFSPDGRSLIVSGDHIQIFGTRDLKLLHLFESGSDICALSADGSMLARVTFPITMDGVTVTEMATGQIHRRLVAASDTLLSVAFSKGDALMAVAGYQKTLAWDLARGQSQIWTEPSESIHGLSFSPDGTHLLSAGPGKALTLRDLHDGGIRRLEGHTATVNAVVFSRDGRMIASGSDDGTVRIWDAVTGALRKVIELPGKVISVDISPDGRLLAAGTAWFGGNAKSDKILHISDINTGEEWMPPLDLGETRSVRFTSDGNTLIVAGVFGTYPAFLNMATRRLRFPAAYDEDQFTNTNDYFALAISPDDSFFVAGSTDGDVEWWDIKARKRIRSVRGHVESVESAAFSNDGRLVASASSDGTLKLWNASTAELILTVAPLKKAYPLPSDDWVVVAPDGRFDTNMDLNHIEGLHWVMADDPMHTKPLEIFMREYYEPGLLHRMLTCYLKGGREACAREFKALPSITSINRVQPHVVETKR